MTSNTDIGSKISLDERSNEIEQAAAETIQRNFRGFKGNYNQLLLFGNNYEIV